MCKSRKWKWDIFLKKTDDRFVLAYKSPAFHPKIRIVALQNAPENPKNMCSSVCKSQNVCPEKFAMYLLFISYDSTERWLKTP